MHSEFPGASILAEEGNEKNSKQTEIVPKGLKQEQILVPLRLDFNPSEQGHCHMDPWPCPQQ